MMFAAVPGAAAAIGIVSVLTSMLLRPRPRNPGRTLRVCKLAHMDIGAEIALPEVVVARNQRGIHAISMRCTHLDCGLTRHTNGFACPCHGSRFDNRGKPVRGPATEALPWYSVQIDEGWVLVDLDREVEAGSETTV